MDLYSVSMMVELLLWKTLNTHAAFLRASVAMALICKVQLNSELEP